MDVLESQISISVTIAAENMTNTIKLPTSVVQKLIDAYESAYSKKVTP